MCIRDSYQDDDMGLEVLRGLDAMMLDLKLDWCEKVSYKRGATDFSSQVAKLKASGCDLSLIHISEPTRPY